MLTPFGFALLDEQRMNDDAYQRHANHYDRCMDPFIGRIRSLALSMAPAVEGMVVLDVGCGTGNILDHYSSLGCVAFGIDSSPSMLSVAREKLCGCATLHLGDASKLPHPDKTFDLITFAHVLHEMSHSTRLSVLSESMRVLKKGGRLLFIDFHAGPLTIITGWFDKILISIFERIAGGEHYNNYRDFLRRGALPYLISEYHLSALRVCTAAGGNIRLYVVCAE